MTTDSGSSVGPGSPAGPGQAVSVLARWAAGLTWSALPADVAEAAREHLIDAVGCAVAGIRRGAAEPALTVARGLGGPPEARLFTGERVGAVAAAFGNAVAVHALDFDDTHAGGLVHASAVTVPVALAVGEQTGASGRDVITALVAGLEVTCRLGAAVPHGFHARGLHATSMCGVIGAAVTAGKLLGLDETRLAHAIGIAASGASGLLEFLHSPASTKQLHPGTAAANGILAARLATAGATGPAGAIDGEYGLFRTMTGRDPHRNTLLGGLSPQPVEPRLCEARAGEARAGEARAVGVRAGEAPRWETTRIGIKPYPACQLTHASIDAAGEFAGSAPSALTVTLHPDAVPIVGGPEKRHPRSVYEAKFSVYWCVAAMVIDGWVDLDTFEDLDRPDVLSLTSRITVVSGAADGVAADAPGIVAGDGRTSRVERSSGAGARTKAAANLGPHAAAVFNAIDRAAAENAAAGGAADGEETVTETVVDGADGEETAAETAVDGAAALLDAIEGCLK